MSHLPRVQPGDPITADFVNQLVDAANACNLTVAQGSGLNLTSGPDGHVLGTTIPLPFWARITGNLSDGRYPFVRLYPTASGGWVASPATGDAYEVSGNLSVAPDTHVKIWRTAAGDYRFLAGSC